MKSPVLKKLMKLVAICIAIVFSTFTYAQTITYKILDSPNFIIEQKKTYTHPTYKSENNYKVADLGPCFNETYIDDENIKTIADLNTYYSKGKMWMPKQWPDSIIVEGFLFKLAEFTNGIKMPVIQTADGTVFSFLIEEGIMAFDVKAMAYEGSSSPVRYDTVEVEKVVSTK